MKRLFLTFLSLLALVVYADVEPKIYRYVPNDGGILYSMTRGNKWAIINLGTSASGGNAVSQLFDMDSGEHFPVSFMGHTLPFTMASNDGNIVVGYYNDRAMTFNREKNEMKVYPNRPMWKNGQLVDCTPDGRYAVGYYQGYLGTNEDTDMPNDWFYRTLYVDTQTGDTIYTPNIPTKNAHGGKLQSVKFTSITPDGRYISGAVDWYIEGGFNFIYDTQTHEVIRGKSLMQLYGGDVASRHEEILSCSGSMMSPSGNAIGGTAQLRRTLPDGTTETVSCRCVWFRETDEVRCYPDAEDGGVGIDCMDDNGTYFGCNETGSPLRSWKVLYDGKYWVSLTQICKQRFGFDFLERTGFERTGTIMGVSPDGHKVISFPDPMGESYCIDFGMSISEACSTLDFLSSFTVTPEQGSQFANFSSVEIKFERPIRVLGNGSNIHLYDSQGNLVANGLSTSSAITLKSGTNNTIICNFRTRTLQAGEEYTFVIDEGTISAEKDVTCKNSEIRVNYVGRSNAPVQMTKSVPEAGSELMRIDNTSSYILLTFDCKVQLTEDPYAYVERVEDGSRAATLAMVAGTAEETKNQVLLYPASTINLFAGQQYRLVVEPGSVCDYSGSAKSANERIEVLYTGSYQRETPTGNVLFADSWDDIAESLITWLRYEGDHNTPQSTMRSWEFDADNQPWNFSIRESNDNPDYCAASHSMYAPSSGSDDWMMTPQIAMPDEGKVTLSFDAQNYLASCKDELEVYVYEDQRVISYLNDNNMADIKQNAKLVFKETLTPGESQEMLTNEWTHYTVDLTPWDGKDIYVAFVNHNYNQSAVFVDNVLVQREVLYALSLDYDDCVVDKTQQTISGKVTIKTDKPVGSISLVLRDADQQEIDRKEWNNISGNAKDHPIPFTFGTPLPLTVGAITTYSIDVTIDDRTDTYKGAITSLAFMPTKRVVLEELTGTDCPNCPQGILAIEKMKHVFGEQFIPVSIHTFGNDPYRSDMSFYSENLGMMSAPSARINRLSGFYYPFVYSNGQYRDSDPANPVWFDIVSQELNRMALCDITAIYQCDASHNYSVDADVRYAVNATNQQLAVVVVLLEDGLVNYQTNSFGQFTDPIFGEWGQGGSLSGEDNNGYVYPVTHNDVARMLVGSNTGGLLGLLPTAFTAGEDVHLHVDINMPQSVMDAANTHVAVMLLNTQTGEVVNAAHSWLDECDKNSISLTPTDPRTNNGTYNLQGQRMSDTMPLPAGIYIRNGKTIMVK